METFTFADFVFILIAVVTVGGGLGVIFSRNIIHAALCLVVSFVGVAAVYFSLSAGFLGVIQIMVYVGAIAVLIIFAIMLVMERDVRKTNMFSRNWFNYVFGIPIIGCVIVSMLVALQKSHFPVSPPPAVDDGVGQLAELMLGDYVVPFEAAAILLLVAVIGAIIMAKGAETK